MHQAQIRYPAGLAPWTMAQYQELDTIPATLLRQVYGLRRTFPSDLIYAPEDMGGCGESRISDAAQEQKWTYLHSLAHNGRTSANVLTSMLQRALTASITDKSVYCTSLVAWGRMMGLKLHQAPSAPILHALSQFIAATSTVTPRPVFSDGSFSVEPPILDMLTRSPAELVSNHAVATKGVYLPPAHGSPAVALRITTPSSSATDAYYQDLLGISVSILAARTTPLNAFSDCSSAITRAIQSLSLLEPAISHLQYGSLLLDIRALSTSSSLPLHLT
jgi:hypothetical protein